MAVRPTSEDTKNQYSTANALLKGVAQDNLKVLSSAMQRMDHYWAGIAYVSDVLEQKALSMC